MDPIRGFYTEHPYPPPVGNLDRARDEWRDENRHRAEHYLFWPDRKYRADIDILVAGCGTWQAAKYALCRPAASVTGIDVSTTSLDHTDKLRRKYELGNLELQQTPIEDVAMLDQRFDLIVCTGVLHHLDDPNAGLRALRSVLRPGGAIYLMVYAPYGRAGVYLLQEYCRRLSIGTAGQEIDDLTAIVEALPRHHPLINVLHSARDALDADALADALLNPRDRSYSVPQLFDLLERGDLEFGRWYWQAPYLPDCGAIATTPHAKRLAALPPSDQYAAMELWRGMLTCHSIIAYESKPPTVSFDDGRWPDYVPLRLPATICVEERLPRGAAGVLLNRSHPFHDLILVINAEEKRLFDRINGCRTIAEICDDADHDLQAFFQRLYAYDQVVFDSSNQSQL